MAIEAHNPFLFIADPAKGRPLYNADLYFGIPDLDPEIPANQVQVSIVQENGTVVAVSQPIQTGPGGVPLYNGSPVQVCVSQAVYSFKALDKNDSQTYYFPRVSSKANAGEVSAFFPALDDGTSTDLFSSTSIYVGQIVQTAGYLAEDDGGGNTYEVVSGGTGTADGGRFINHPTGLQLKGLFPGNVVRPEQFGAVGDASTDDLTAIENADAYGNVTFSKKYRVSSNLLLTRRADFEGNASILPDPSVVVTFSPDQGDIYGRWLGLFGGNVSADESKEFQDAVYSASGRTLVIDTAGIHNIQTAILMNSDTTIKLFDHTTIVRNANIDNMIRNNSDGVSGGYSANANMTIEGGVWDGNSANFPTAASLIVFGHATNVKIKNATLLNTPSFHPIEVNAVSGAEILNCKFIGWTRTAVAEAVQIDLMINSGAFPWFGPYDNTTCENVTVDSCWFEDGGSGVGTHSSIPAAIHRNIRIQNCTFTDLEWYGVPALNWSGVWITDNKFETMNFGVRASTDSTILVDYHITGNSFFDITTQTQGRAIWINGVDAANRYFQEIFIENNFVREVGRHGIGLDYCLYATVSGNIVRRCQNTGIWIFGCRVFSVTNNVAQLNNLAADPSSYDLTIGQTGSNDTGVGTVVGNTFTDGRADNINEVLMRQNTADTSLSIGTTTTSSTNENLVAGVLT